MALQEDVEKAIRHGRSVIRKHCYNLNETITRYAIIDPVLTAPGWKLDDPVQCKFEQRRNPKGQEYLGRPDYCLYKNCKLVALIEAKALRKHLNEFSEENQLAGYSADPTVWVLTNGSHWYFYSSWKEFGDYRYPDINIEFGQMADIEDDKKTGRNATIGEMAQELIRILSYRRL